MSRYRTHTDKPDGILRVRGEYRILVDDMVDLTDVEKDEVPGNPYRVQEDVVVAEPIIEPTVEYSCVKKSQIRKLGNRSFGTQKKSPYLCLIN